MLLPSARKPDLYSYAASSKAVEYISGDDSTCLSRHVNLINVFQRLKRVPNVHIFIPLTDTLHYCNHVVPYVKEVGIFLKEENHRDVYFKVSIEHNESVPVGHAPLSKGQFKECISNLFAQMERESISVVRGISKVKKYIRNFKA